MSNGDRQPEYSQVRTIPGETVYRDVYAGIREMNVVLPADVLDALAAARVHDRAESRANDRAESRANDRAESRANDRAESRANDRAESRASDRAESRAGGLAAGAASGAACFVLDSIIENAGIARAESLPMCQDTGLVLVFIEQGYDVRVAGDPLDIVVRRAIGDAYRDGKFRASVVDDPLNGRKNTGTNLPPVIYSDAVPGSGLTISCLSKGFGSENYSRTFMLKPTQSKDAVIEAVLETMKAAGGNCCPPVILGVGIGGTMDWAAKISKKALLRDLADHHPDPFYRGLEAEILAAVNALGIGAGGLGGRTTALGVHIETYPTHIAGLPVAVSVNCWAERKAVLTW